MATAIPDVSQTRAQQSGAHGTAPSRVPTVPGRIVGWCSLVIVVHLLIDAFVDLRPGTSAGDHLVSGTVPIAVVAVLAVVFMRVRDGLAATIALLLGLAAVGAGGTNLAMIVVDDGTVFDRVSVGRVTGIAAGLAGAVLVGRAVIMLLRSRRLGGSRVRRIARRVGPSVLGLLLILLIPQPIVFGYIIANWSVGYALDEVELEPSYEPVTLETDDGLRLVAAYRPSSNGAAVIVFPGRLATHTDLLARHGYGILLLEPRGRHDSEGDVHLLGWTGEEDVRAAIRYLQTRPDIDDGRIGGLGISVGGELMLQTAANEPALRAVVSEGAGTRWVAEEFDRDAPLTEWPVVAINRAGSVVGDLATAVFSNSLPPPRIQDRIAAIAPRPILLIWTPNGAGGEELNPQYYERAGEPKTIWEIPESEHVGGIRARPAEYERRVVGFFDDALLDGRR